jgi:hypothetical protein
LAGQLPSHSGADAAPHSTAAGRHWHPPPSSTHAAPSAQLPAHSEFWAQVLESPQKHDAPICKQNWSGGHAPSHCGVAVLPHGNVDEVVLVEVVLLVLLVLLDVELLDVDVVTVVVVGGGGTGFALNLPT